MDTSNTFCQVPKMNMNTSSKYAYVQIKRICLNTCTYRKIKTQILKVLTCILGGGPCCPAIFKLMKRSRFFIDDIHSCLAA